MSDLPFSRPENGQRGRPRGFDIDDALDKAITVFSNQGYHGTAITDLSKAMGLTAGSLYKAFTDKRGILLAAFDRYRTVRSGKLSAALAGHRTGRDGIRAAITFYAEAAHGESGRCGCLVVATAAEMAQTDPQAAARVEKAHATNEAILRDLIVAGQADGSIAAAIDPQSTARALLCLLQGMRLVGKTGHSRDDMLAIVDVAMKLIDE